MPATQRHPLLRPVLTIAIIVGVLLFLVGLFYTSNTNRTQQRQQQQQQAQPPGQASSDAEQDRSEPAEPEPGVSDVGAPGEVADSEQAGSETGGVTAAAGAPSVVTPSDAPAPASLGLRARVQPQTDQLPIGSLEPASPKEALIEFTLAGAGVKAITMADYYESVEAAVNARANPAQAEGHYPLQRDVIVDGQALISLAARAIVIDGVTIDLFASPLGEPLWRQTAPGAFEAEIISGGGETGLPETMVARLERRFTLLDDSFEIVVEQRVVNLTDRPLDVRWIQWGPVDLQEDPSGFRIPTRRIRFGYLLDPSSDPSRQIVEADDRLLTEKSLLTDMAKAFVTHQQLWPDPKHYKNAGELSWVSQTSRYFAFAVHPLLTRDEARLNLDAPQTHPLDKTLDLAERVEAIRLGDGEDAHVVLQMHSTPMTIAPGATQDLSFGAFAGPMTRRVLSRGVDPVYGALDLGGIVIYQIGFCGWCTFQPIARMLLIILDFFHTLVGDWALSIILLVLCVRALLHPIFKKSQISMMRFGKQMQAVQPKIKKIQEKYKNDPAKLKEEQMRLMREERINYAGALGCLPMFLQTPIWIALYASLFFAFELRHEPAFYGVFQAISGGSWHFLADLSRPDNFISFGTNFHIPFLSGMMGTFGGINILPLMWGVIFYIHQKYITPPTSSNLSPEQEQTQKIMKIMMVVMMPVFMYNAPSGLLIYFVTNSVIAIAEGRYIRSHVDKLDLEAPAKPKPHQLGRKRVKNTATMSANPFAKRKGGNDKRSRYKSRGE